MAEDDKARDEDDREELERDETEGAADAASPEADDAVENDGAGNSTEARKASAGEEPEAQGPKNRAERRRALAQKRRKGKASALDEAPNDRNLRKRQELLEKRKGVRANGEGDDAGPSDVELAVDDALARTGEAAGRFFKRNWPWMQWALAAGIVGGIGALVYVWRSGATNAVTSDMLASAIAAEQARVIPADKDKRTDEEKKKNDRVVYASYAERDKVAVERYQKVASGSSGSGPTVLAQLGLAGSKLDGRDWDGAIAGFENVLQSKLAQADLDVKARALEGLAFAFEGKKDAEKANATFEKLGDLPLPVMKPTAKYHRARVLLGKGDKDGAKKLLEETRKDLETAELEVKRVSGGGMNPFNGLRNAVEQTLRRIDPSAVPPKFVQGAGAGGPSGGMQITPEQIKQILEQKGIQPGSPGRAE